MENTPLNDGAERLSQRRAMLAGLGGLAAGAMLTRTAGAGDLDPPAGTIAPTMKNLDIVEPRIPIGPDTTPGDANSVFRIAQGGSYYLTGDIVGESGKHGILIAASNVVIDLNGFRLLGVPGSLNGIHMQAIGGSIVVRNGTIASWGGDGMLVRASNGAIENIHSRFNGGWGIFNPSSASTRITGCSAVQNGASIADSGGISVLEGATIESCQARTNTGSGIRCGGGATISGNTAVSNTGDGILASAGAVITQNSSYTNGGSGIVTSSGATISGNSVVGNSLDGIRAHSHAYIFNNVCWSNLAAGVHTTASANRIDSNSCVSNIRGFKVDTQVSLIIRNSASGNTVHYEIAAGNVCFVINAATGGAINGAFGGAPPGTENPWANFSYPMI